MVPALDVVLVYVSQYRRIEDDIIELTNRLQISHEENRKRKSWRGVHTWDEMARSVVKYIVMLLNKSKQTKKRIKNIYIYMSNMRLGLFFLSSLRARHSEITCKSLLFSIYSKSKQAGLQSSKTDSHLKPVQWSFLLYRVSVFGVGRSLVSRNTPFLNISSREFGAGAGGKKDWNLTWRSRTPCHLGQKRVQPSWWNKVPVTCTVQAPSLVKCERACRCSSSRTLG